jgi:hypothetical protein
MRPAGPILPSLVKVTEQLYMFAFDDVGEQNGCAISVLTFVSVTFCSGNRDCYKWKYIGNTVNVTLLCKSDST